MEVPFAVPECGADEIQEVADVIRSGWLTTGSRCARFEEDPSSSCRKFRHGCTTSWLGCGGKEGGYKPLPWDAIQQKIEEDWKILLGQNDVESSAL